jgi:hypothetical protein
VINGMTNGQSLVLPNSIALTFGNVPRNLTISLIAVGLGGLALLARKRHAYA